MHVTSDELTGICTRLAAGAGRHAGRDAAGRAALARSTAFAVARVADDWVSTAVAIKAATGSAAAVAEETATGPIATLRLLLVTARALADVATRGVPRVAGPPRVLAAGRAGAVPLIGVEVIPEPGLHDAAICAGMQATVRCVDPGGTAAFARSWAEEARTRPAAGGVAVVLGAGNVTGLAVADAISQIFEHGRAVLLKLHPLHAPLAATLQAALAPLVAADLVAIVAGGTDVAARAVAEPLITDVHLTGGQAAFDAVVWGGPGPRPADAVPRLTKPITCELGNVTPWIVVPGRYTPRQLRHQADVVAASIANNTSFNCIATKCVVTCRSWEQRDEFLALVAGRLATLQSRPAWYPGAAAAWEAVTGRPAPADGTLPCVFHAGLDREREPHWLEREWFGPVAVETPLDGDSLDDFCSRAMSFVHTLPGSLAASVTVPAGLDAHAARRVDLLVEHLEYGVVACNTWSALAYSYGSVPWGGFPGATLAEPQSGIGHVHDPLLLPLVHNAIIRAPLVSWPKPPWFPWHRHGAALARGVLGMYGGIAAGRSCVWELLRMLPRVMRG
ncbi:MAG: hypothetical protein ACK6CT_11250 [Planctomycetia bacterium]